MPHTEAEYFSSCRLRCPIPSFGQVGCYHLAVWFNWEIAAAFCRRSVVSAVVKKLNGPLDLYWYCAVRMRSPNACVFFKVTGNYAGTRVDFLSHIVRCFCLQKGDAIG